MGQSTIDLVYGVNCVDVGQSKVGLSKEGFIFAIPKGESHGVNGVDDVAF